MKNTPGKNKEDAWKQFEANHYRGETIICAISRLVADIGLFVKLEGGIEGIVHLSDLDWEKPSSDAIEKYHIGDAIELMILAVEPDRERVCLGVKQLKPRPDLKPNGDPSAPLPIIPGNPKSPNSGVAALKNGQF